MFYKCEKCGGKLIERLPNGVWQFKFGKQPGSQDPAVDMQIYGSIKLRCWRRSCRHINMLTYFPGQEFPQSNQSDSPKTETDVEDGE